MLVLIIVGLANTGVKAAPELLVKYNIFTEFTTHSNPYSYYIYI